ncbi:hypothetical protein Pan181_29520 [Aeoliella mucimassa]|uniref:Uncharacterized protein n=1 Tax=Aeoliella mucimassa TaxID=2527972 RepID=A0A518APV7_9BACT|nr:hypothetical protein Pan181_29520 [Aeoliella mucimassa]
MEADRIVIFIKQYHGPADRATTGINPQPIMKQLLTFYLRRQFTSPWKRRLTLNVHHAIIFVMYPSGDCH